MARKIIGRGQITIAGIKDGANYTPNLLKESNVRIDGDGYHMGSYKWDERPLVGTKCTLTVCAKVGDTKDDYIGIYQDNGYQPIATFSSKTEEVKTFKFTIIDNQTSGSINDYGIGFWHYPRDGDYDSGSYIKWAVVTVGDTPQTAWIPAASEMEGHSVKIDSTEVRYSTVHSSSTQPADNTFTLEDVPTLSAGEYLWSLTTVTYNNGESTKTYGVSRIGTNGLNGTNGKDGVAWGNGKMLAIDPTFKNGNNGIGVYNNYNNGNVIHARIEDPTAPNDSGMVLRIRNIGESHPSNGGFYHTPANARASATFIQRFVAKVPVGYRVYEAHNNIGSTEDGALVEWLTPQTGTGTWEEYVLKWHIADNPGTTPFSNFSHIYIRGGGNGTEENPVDWFLAYATLFDMDANGEFLIESQSVTYAKTATETQPADTAFIYNSIGATGVGAGEYLWTKTVVEYSDGTATKSYSVSRVGSDGADGQQGPAGADGLTPYVHYAYANSADGTVGFSTTYFTGALYVGVCSTYTKADPTTASSYEWARLKGEDGTQAKMVVVNPDAVAFTYTNDFASLEGPQSITLSATLQGTTGYQWSYKTVAMSDFSNINGATGATYDLANNSVLFGSERAVTIRCTSGGMHDEVTIVKVSSGANYTPNLAIGTKDNIITSPNQHVDYDPVKDIAELGRGAKFTVSFEYEYSDVSTGAEYYKRRIVSSITYKNESGTTKYLETSLYLPANSTGLSGKGRYSYKFQISDDADFTQAYSRKYPFTSQIASGNVKVWNYKIEEGWNDNPVWTPATSEMMGKDGASAITFKTGYKETLNVWKMWLNTETETNGWSVDGLHGAKVGDTAIVPGYITDLDTDCYFIGEITRIDSSTRICVRTPLPLYYGKPGENGKDGSSYTENLALKSSEERTASGYFVSLYDLSEELVKGDQYTITIWGEPSENHYFGIWDSLAANVQLSNIPKIADGVYSGTFKYTIYGSTTPNNKKITIYSPPSNIDFGTSVIHKLKLEKGDNTNPVWTPNPADTEAITIVLSNESHIFEGDTEKAIAASTECEVIAYKGATRVAATIGAITGVTAGMWASIQNNGSQDAAFTINVTTGLTAKQGVLNVPVTVDGKTFTKEFSWSLSLRGKNAQTISVKSGGWGGSQQSSFGYVKVNGGIVSTSMTRGLNMVTLDRATLAKVAQINYDLYAYNTSVEQARAAFLAKIDALDDTVFVCLAFADNMTWTDDMVEAMKKLGSLGDIKTDGANRTFAFIGYKGLTPGYAVQTQGENQGMPPAELSVCVADGMFTTSKTQVGFKDVIEEYYLSTSRLTLQGGSWTTKEERPEWSAGHYWWTRTHIVYTDGTETYTAGLCVMGEEGQQGLQGLQGPQGEQGIQGPAGNGLSEINEYYALNNSDSTIPTSWQKNPTTVPVPTSTMRYLWNYEEAVYTSGARTDMQPHVVAMYSEDGSPGTDGRSLVNTVNYYLATTDGTNAPTNGWVTDATASGFSEAKRYLWTYEVNTYDKAPLMVTTQKRVLSVWGQPGEDGKDGKDGSSYTENLLLESSKGWENTNYPTATIQLGIDRLTAGEKFTATLWGASLGEGKTGFSLYNSGGWIFLGNFKDSGKGFLTLKGTWSIASNNGEYTSSNTHVNIYPIPSSVTGVTNRIEKVKIERGWNDNPVWTPATSEMMATYFHIKYSDVPNPTLSSQMTETPSTYIGTYVDSTLADSNDPSKYTWARFQGLQGEKGDRGIPGVNGTDGETYYLHIKYSNDGGVTFTPASGGLAAGETPGDWIGQKVDTTETDTENPSAYTWSKTKGEDSVTYDIIPTEGIIKRSPDGELSANSVGCIVYKTEGITRSLTDDYLLLYQRQPDGLVGTLTRDGGVSSPVPLLKTTESVKFWLMNDKSDILDLETVYVVEDASGIVVGGTNLLMDSSFRYENRYWTMYNYGNYSSTIDSSELMDGRNSLRLLAEGLTSNAWAGTYQDVGDIDWQTTMSYTASLYVKTKNLSAQGECALEIRCYSAPGVLIKSGVQQSIKQSKANTWERFTLTFKPLEGTKIIRFYVFNVRNGDLLISSPKLEIGNKATGWAMNPKDTDYLTKALLEDFSAEGGLIQAALLRMGVQQPNGSLLVKAGVNGIVDNKDFGGGLAFFAGGDMIDAETNPTDSQRAQAAIRHDGTGYAAGNTIKFRLNEVRIGENEEIALTRTGLQMFNDADEVVLNIANQPIDFDENSIINSNQRLSVPYTEYKVEYDNHGYMKLSQSATFSLGTLHKGDTVSVEIDAKTTAWDSYYGEVNDPPYLYVSASGAGVFTAAIMSIDNVSYPTGSGRATAKGQFTAPSDGSYTLEFALSPNREAGGSVDTATVTIGGTCQISRNNTERMQIGNNGQCSVWGNSAMVFTEKLFFVRVGSYSFKIDDTGIKKRVGTGSWQNL